MIFEVVKTYVRTHGPETVASYHVSGKVKTLTAE